MKARDQVLLERALRRSGAVVAALAWALTAIGTVPAAPARATADFVDAATSPIAYTRPVVRATASCTALAGRTVAGAAITSAKLIAATPPLPAYCDVAGVSPPSVRFDIALPIAWNARLYSTGDFGCGGMIESLLRQRNIAVANNFAAVSTDNGIENYSQTCAWAAGQPNLAIDFAYAGMHQTAVVAKALVALFYARAPLASYYESCSDGGHDGLEEAERYPDDYDGIVAGDPLLGAGTLMAMAWTTTTFANLPPDQAMTPAKVNYIASVVFGKCDKLDGVVDGLIADPQACAAAFVPARDLAVCAPGTNGDACLTPAQLAAYVRAMGPVMSGTTPIYPGQPYGTEVEFFAGEIPPPGTTLGSTLDYFLAATYMQYLFPWPQTAPAQYTPFTFDFANDPARIVPFRTMFDPTNLDLHAFLGRGGKLLTYTGLADPVATAYGTMAFYDDLVSVYGPALRSSALLYPVPGMWHCQAGRGPDHFDPMTKVIDWFEGNLQPNTILARRVNAAGTVLFTRTLCPYPQVGYYRSGNPSLASSFTCVERPPGVPGAGSGDDLQLP